MISLHAHTPIARYCNTVTAYNKNNTQCLNTYQKASTKNFPALFNIASSFCCVLFINFTFRGLNNIAPSPNIGGPPAENASTCLVAVVSMTIHIIIKKQCVIVLLVCVIGEFYFCVDFAPMSN